VSHYGLDLISVTDIYSAGAFASYARAQIGTIIHQSSLPIICGGTGLYIDMTLADPSVDRWTADRKYRLYLEELIAVDVHSIYRLLQEIDPRIAQTLHPNATRHIMGALEYHHATGKRKSDSILSSHAIDYLYDIFWITPYIDSPHNRDTLYNRINQRISQMMQSGLLAEYDAIAQQY
jgi:tRNA dimethylallyltransferase